MELDYHKFSQLKDIQKLTFLEDFINSPPDLKYISEKNIRYFFRDIIEREEDIYLRKLSIEILSFLTATKFLKKSFIIPLLLDIDDNPILEVTALKYLYYFYDNNTDIKEKFDKCLTSENGDVCSEAYYRLGLIEFLNNLSLDNELEYLKCIDRSSVFFRRAYELSENRVDAYYFFEVTNFIKAILDDDKIKSDELFENLLNISLKRSLLINNPNSIILEVKIQSILNNVYFIYKNSTRHSEWINYREQFGELAQYYFELLNISIKKENTHYKLIQHFKDNIKSNILERLFIQNFSFYERKIETIKNKYRDDKILNDFLELVLNTIQQKKKKKNLLLN